MKHLVLILMLSVAPTGCDPPAETKSPVKPPHEQIEASNPEISQSLMIALSLAKNAHHRADVFLKDGNVEKAIESVQTILRITFPKGFSEEQDTKFDARARLGKLYLGIGKLDEARRVVDEGLAQASRRSFFLANLYTVSGEIYTEQTRPLDKTDPNQARELRHRALEAFDMSREIALEVQGTILKESGQ